VCCIVLRRVAVCCSVLQYAVVCPRHCVLLQHTLQHTTAYCSMFAVCCSVLDLHSPIVAVLIACADTATCFNMLQHAATYRYVFYLRCVRRKYSKRCCVAVCCSVLQCVVVCCSVLCLSSLIVAVSNEGEDAATHCNTQQHAAARCNILQHAATL